MSFISCRRYFVDSFLKKESNKMSGNIIDIGGKKVKKRGNFYPPSKRIDSWKYINNDSETEPDILCNAERIPLDSELFDGFLLCEVLEHLEYPEEVLREAFRLLKPGGLGWITMPFLYSVHADPYDYQRWTDTKLEKVLRDTGFSDIQIEPMGGIFSVLYDLFYNTKIRTKHNPGLFVRALFNLIGRLNRQVIILDKKMNYYSRWINTGYSVVVKK